ncbi:MAG: RNA-protein complex protein Nop10 [Nitrososphaerales archaeon]
MKPLMRKCKACNAYTFETVCPKCNGETTTHHPPKFSPDDRYARYRISERYKTKE